MWGVSALFLSLTIAGGCGSSGSTPANDAAANPDVSAVAIGTLVRGPIQPCTEPHTMCVTATFAATMTTQPTLISVNLFADVPPTHPPDGTPMFIESPNIVAGETVQLRMSDLNLTGTYHFLGAVYMPGGGTRIPVQAVDYSADSSVAYAITGAALNLPETFNFQFYR